ncbi:hypothetical protein NIES4074_10920 [Cylindrospermum sp. NIES-4074]|nr:hypothetical protein NIES4074_10920 [Cylindrospermum sp. NIES-4074]
MLTSSFLKQLTYYPLIASLLIALVGYSDIAPGFKNRVKMGINSSQPLAILDKPGAVNVAQTTIGIDEKTALNSVWNLPQVRRKAREIEKLSKGRIRVASAVDSSPTESAPYYTVLVFEIHPDKSKDTIYWFRVLSSNGEIQVLDLIRNEYISLSKWNPDGR